jgi:hypothetical protein
MDLVEGAVEAAREKPAVEEMVGLARLVWLL